MSLLLALVAPTTDKLDRTAIVMVLTVAAVWSWEMKRTKATQQLQRRWRFFIMVTRATLPIVEKMVWRSEFVRENCEFYKYTVDFDGAKLLEPLTPERSLNYEEIEGDDKGRGY